MRIRYLIRAIVSMTLNAGAAQHPDGLMCFRNARIPSMRIVNVDNGYRLKMSRAIRAIEECSAEWVEPGVSIRSLTLKESIAARNKQAQDREPLPYAEIPGLRYEPTARGTDATRREGKMMWLAHEFVMRAA